MEASGGVVSEGTVEVDTSDWTLDDWLKDDSATRNTESYEIVARDGATVTMRSPFVISNGVIPVKVGLLQSHHLDVWKKSGMHESMLYVKEEARRLTKDFKRVDAIRPYGKPGPVCTASVHPARADMRPGIGLVTGFIYVGLDLSGATHGIITSKVTQSYAVLDELAAAIKLHDKLCLQARVAPNNPAVPQPDKVPCINFHPRMENFDYSDYKGCVAVAANYDAESLSKILENLAKSEYGQLCYFKTISKKEGVQVEAHVGGERVSV